MPFQNVQTSKQASLHLNFRLPWEVGKRNLKPPNLAGRRQSPNIVFKDLTFAFFPEIKNQRISFFLLA